MSGTACNWRILLHFTYLLPWGQWGHNNNQLIFFYLQGPSSQNKGHNHFLCHFLNDYLAVKPLYFGQYMGSHSPDTVAWHALGQKSFGNHQSTQCGNLDVKVGFQCNILSQWQIMLVVSTSKAQGGWFRGHMCSRAINSTVGTIFRQMAIKH